MNQVQPLCQLIDRATVANVVHDFYRNLRADGILAPYFTHIDDWPAHESHITDFWWGLMGGKVELPRPHAMEAGHRDLDFGPQELAQWLKLFEETLQQNLPAEAAEAWASLARQLGHMMSKRGLVRGSSSAT